jgi:hypothetical protein
VGDSRILASTNKHDPGILKVGPDWLYIRSRIRTGQTNFHFVEVLKVSAAKQAWGEFAACDMDACTAIFQSTKFPIQSGN